MDDRIGREKNSSPTIDNISETILNCPELKTGSTYGFLREVPEIIKTRPNELQRLGTHRIIIQVLIYSASLPMFVQFRKDNGKLSQSIPTGPRSASAPCWRPFLCFHNFYDGLNYFVQLFFLDIADSVQDDVSICGEEAVGP